MKKIWLTLLAGLSFCCLLLGGACEKQQPLAFNENYIQEIELGDPIMLDEYIDLKLTDDYTAILRSNATGEEYDLKRMGQWTTEYPGEFTLTYTVNSGPYAGTISTVLSVYPPKLKWDYSDTTVVYRDGETMSFNRFFNTLNIAVESYYDYDLYMKSVIYNETETDLTGKDEFVFDGAGGYVFTFAVRSEDGQELSAEQLVTVRTKQTMGEGAQDWLDENDMQVHDYINVTSDGGITLDAGYYTTEMIHGDVPYVAFENAAALDTYVMTEFTGKNLPQIAFFCNDITSNPMDGGRGIYIHNGLTYADGGLFSQLDASRLTVFGPNKILEGKVDSDGRFDGSVRGSVANPCPMSYLGLKEDNQYRYIVGFTDGSAESVTLRILLINMTTLEREFDHSYKCKSVSGIGEIDFTDYFNGSIVLYGRYGVETKLDKVYAPFKNVTDIYSLDVAASFKEGYKTQYPLNSIASVSNYIDTSYDYEFRVIDPDGLEVAISEDGLFTYTKSGSYRLVYDSLEEGVRASSVTVDVMFDPTQEADPDYYETVGIFEAQQVRAGMGLIANSNSKYIKEGSTSIKYYTSRNTTEGWGIVVGLSSAFLDFMFLSRDMDGFTFDVYSPIALNYKLYPKNGSENNLNKLQQQLNGSIEAETWTTFTITRDLCNINSLAYNDWCCSLAISFYAETELPEQSCVYIDNVKLFGQKRTSVMSDGANAFLQENNMSAYGYQSINDDMQVSLYGGVYQGGDDEITNDDVPYISYNGDYGVGSYVAVDFTGKNVPQFCLFAGTVTSSLTDGLSGVYISTGLTRRNGSLFSDTDGGRVTFLGPNKVEYRRLDSTGRFDGAYGSVDEPAALSIRGLQDGVHYRYVVGIKSADASTQKVVLELLLINLDTGELLFDKDKTITCEAFTQDYLTGNIVMYGRYNAAITLDKVYAIYEGVTDVKSIDVVASALAS